MALILDAGPLYAALDQNDADHLACRRLIETAREPLVIPASVFPEVDYWISRRLRPNALVDFLDDVIRGAYRIRELCDRYADSDIGFVDASVLAIVERPCDRRERNQLGEPKLATLDHRHFGMMRPRHVEALQLLPE